MDGLVFDDGHTGLIIGGLNIRHQTGLKTTLESCLQSQHIAGLPVGGEDDLLAVFVEGIEGVEKLLLGDLLAGNELHIVD